MVQNYLNGLTFHLYYLYYLGVRKVVLNHDVLFV